MKKIFFLFLIIQILLLSGCQKNEAFPEKITISENSDFYFKPTSKMNSEKNKIKIRVFSQKIPGFLGGKGKSVPLKNVYLNAEIQNKTLKNVFFNNEKKKIVLKTDEGGNAQFFLKCFDYIGKIDIKIEVLSYNGKELTNKIEKNIILYSGLELIGTRQEGITGKRLKEPVGVILYNKDGNPLNGVEVLFSGINGASVSKEKVITDISGKAFTNITLGKKSGKSSVLISVSHPDLFVPNIKIDSLGVNFYNILFFLLGSLALFIYGMKTMSDGLQKIAGNRLKSILDFLTKNRVIALATGAVATAVIQSSSACTVMIVGFLNAGLMGLRQSMAAIMGANIGTTITGQIIAFKISQLAYPALILGIILMFVFKNKKIGLWGDFIFGFGLLFIGMQGMSESLHPLRDSEVFKNVFAMFECTPVNGYIPIANLVGAVLTGAIVTAIIQSSSATIGLTMVLAGSGLISFWTAFPLVLGDNIGTTITAVLASLGGNRNCKRAGIFHAIFNITGSLIMIILLYIPYKGIPIFIYFIESFTPGKVLSEIPVNIERHIAMAHSFFNVSIAFILLPFIGTMANLIEKMVPMLEEEKENVTYLENNLLLTPELAFNQIKNEMIFMLEVASKNVFRALNCLENNNSEKLEKIKKKEEEVDKLQENITNYVIELGRNELLKEQALRIPDILHCVNDIERIGDLAEKLRRIIKLKHRSQLEFSESALKNINQIEQILQIIFKELLELLKNENKDITQIMNNENKINIIARNVSENNNERIKTGECLVGANISFIGIVNTLERVGDHYVNIAERIQNI